MHWYDLRGVHNKPGLRHCFARVVRCGVMWAAIFRSRAFSLSSPYSHVIQSWKLGLPCVNRTLWTSFVDYNSNNKNDEKKTLNLQEVEKVLSDVKADDVKVIPVHNHCDYTDFMVIATGRSTWHVKNIAQALIYKAGSSPSLLILVEIPKVLDLN